MLGVVEKGDQICDVVEEGDRICDAVEEGDRIYDAVEETTRSVTKWRKRLDLRRKLPDLSSLVSVGLKHP
ncbi:hypothetical protein SESBI_13551 [Sesbania bispinosa]|nr:hypothetical protein SESBI_13551 [Sesbania bispinosa]